MRPRAIALIISTIIICASGVTGAKPIFTKPPNDPINARPPNDPDNDGLYEDVNGDNQTNIIDVGALLQDREKDDTQKQADKFDFNQDGELNIIDVGKLYAEVTS